MRLNGIGPSPVNQSLHLYGVVIAVEFEAVVRILASVHDFCDGDAVAIAGKENTANHAVVDPRSAQFFLGKIIHVPWVGLRSKLEEFG